MIKKATNRPIRSAKVTNQPCPPRVVSLRRAIAAFRSPAAAAASGRHGLFFLLMAVLLGEIGEQHLTHEGGTFRLADHQHTVDDKRTVDLLVNELQVQLVGYRQAEKVGDRGAVKRR